MSSTDLRSSWLMGEKKRGSSSSSANRGLDKPHGSNSEGHINKVEVGIPPSSPVSKRDINVGSVTTTTTTEGSPSSIRKESSRENIPLGFVNKKDSITPRDHSATTNSPSPNNNNNSNNANNTYNPLLRRDNSMSTLVGKNAAMMRERNATTIAANGSSGSNSNNNSSNNGHELGMQARITRKKDDVEGLMSRVWDKYYKEGELFVQVVDCNVPQPRVLQDTEMLLIVESKTFTQRWGSDFLVEVDDRSFGEITLELVTATRLNRKKLGGCKIVVQGRLEDGKAQEGWHNLAKRSRKGEIRSKGHLKIRICYTSALTRNKDYCMAKEKFNDIMQILFDKETLIVCTLCKLYKEEDLSKTLIRLFNSQKQASLLLMNLLMREIYTQEDSATLFRRDSMGTKTARNFFSLVAKSYLKRHILPFIAYITYEVTKGSCYEVDPAKLSSTEEISGNATRLLAGVKKFLTAILDSCDDLPISVRLFFSNLNVLVKKRIKKSSSPIGALFFLRFVCPAVLFPHQFGLMEKPLEAHISRPLVLVTKILQNLVNGCLFHEEYMTIFNSFITDNVAPINGFFEQLCTEPKAKYFTEDDKQPPYTMEEQIQLLSIVVRKIHIYFEKIQVEIERDPIYASSPEEAHQKYLLAKLKTLFLERILSSPTDEAELDKEMK